MDKTAASEALTRPGPGVPADKGPHSHGGGEEEPRLHGPKVDPHGGALPGGPGTPLSSTHSNRPGSATPAEDMTTPLPTGSVGPAGVGRSAEDVPSRAHPEEVRAQPEEVRATYKGAEPASYPDEDASAAAVEGAPGDGVPTASDGACMGPPTYISGPETDGTDADCSTSVAAGLMDGGQARPAPDLSDEGAGAPGSRGEQPSSAEDQAEGADGDGPAKLDERDWKVIRALGAGATHEQAAAEVDRHPKWVQRRLKDEAFKRAFEAYKKQLAERREATYNALDDALAKAAIKAIGRVDALADSPDPAVVIKVASLLLKESSPRRRFHLEHSLRQLLQEAVEELRAEEDGPWGPDGGVAA